MFYCIRIIILFIIAIVSYLITYLLLCPPRRFFKDMPKNILKKGKFQPYIYKAFLCKDSKKIYSKHIYKRLLFAYLDARYHACKLDMSTLGKEYGICWGIQPLK